MIIFTIFRQFVFVLKSDGITNNTDLNCLKICCIKLQYLNLINGECVPWGAGGGGGGGAGGEGVLSGGGGGGGGGGGEEGLVVRVYSDIFEQHRLGLLWGSYLICISFVRDFCE